MGTRQNSPTSGRVDDVIKLAARVGCPVLITGHSAHHREAVARLIHRGGRFVRVDCTTLDDSVFSSVLDHASGGTLFIDEIGVLRPQMQARLSLFLEQHAIRRLESTRHAVRVVAGSDANLMSGIAANQFSANLFYRLNLIHIEVSELRMVLP